MTHFKQVTLVALFALFLSSCTIYNGNMTGSASLSENNFSYAQQNISGTAKATYFFGVGGMNRHALVKEAKETMLADNPLQKGQALANVSVDYKSTSVIFQLYRRVTCTVSADVVQFE